MILQVFCFYLLYFISMWKNKKFSFVMNNRRRETNKKLLQMKRNKLEDTISLVSEEEGRHHKYMAIS